MHKISTKNHITVCSSLEETHLLAHTLAAQAKPGDVFALSGDLGSGKTAFAKAFIQSFFKTPIEVPSPTFNIALPYDTPKGKIWHFDLYRIEQPKELIELGLEEMLEHSISLIEWPEIAADFLPKTHHKLHFTIGQDEDARVITIESPLSF